MNTLKDYVNYKLTHADKAVEASGYPLKLENCKKHKKMRQLEIYGNSFQDGTPSPENPIEVQSVGELVTDETDTNYGKYKIPVVQRGKNLLKPTKASAQGISITYVTTNSYGTTIDSTDFSDNKMVITQTKYPNTSDISHYTNGYFAILTEGLVVGQKYVISFDVEVLENPLDATFLAIYSGGYFNAIAGISQNKQRVKAAFTHRLLEGDYKPYIEIRNCGMSLTASNFMITEVDEDIEFEPYVEPVTTNVFLNEPLRKIGDYADYVDFKNSKIVRNNKEIVFNGSENWVYEKVTYGNNFYTWIGDAYPNQYFPLFCNMGCYANGDLHQAYTCRISSTQNFNFRYQDYNNLADLKNKLLEMYNNNNPFIAVYRLATPTKESISLDLPKLNAKTTIIEVGTSLSPYTMKAKYIKK